MPLNTDHFEALKDFIRQHRSNESNYAALHQRLQAELENAKNGGAAPEYAASLQEIKEKQVADYQAAKETGGTAWPEFEKFVAEWEKAITAALQTPA